jgi:predicted phage terminase large subunit-like protein
MGGRLATSTGGAVTGFHAHVIVVDDPLNPKEAISDADNRTAHNWIGQTLSTRKVDKRVTPTIMIMQRLHEDDPAGRMIEEGRTGARRIRHINLPAEIDERNAKDVRPRGLRKLYKPDPDRPGSKLLDPVRIPRDVLEEFKSDNLLGEYGYAGQMLQRPVPFGGGLFKIDRIHVHEVAPARARFRQVVRFWDKAGTEGGGAFTVGKKMGETVDGEYYGLDVKRGQWDTGAREEVIVQTAALDGRDVVIGIEQEPGSGGKESAENTVKRLAGYSVVVVKPSGDKIVRAVPFSSQVNSGNFSVVVGDWTKAYLGELELFPVSKYKDQVDASSGAFTVLTQGGRIGVIK